MMLRECCWERSQNWRAGGIRWVEIVDTFRIWYRNFARETSACICVFGGRHCLPDRLRDILTVTFLKWSLKCWPWTFCCRRHPDLVLDCDSLSVWSQHLALILDCNARLSTQSFLTKSFDTYFLLNTVTVNLMICETPCRCSLFRGVVLLTVRLMFFKPRVCSWFPWTCDFSWIP